MNTFISLCVHIFRDQYTEYFKDSSDVLPFHRPELEPGVVARDDVEFVGLEPVAVEDGVVSDLLVRLKREGEGEDEEEEEGGEEVTSVRCPQ